MAKTIKNNFGFGPWPMKPKEFETFSKVTESNRSNAIVYGRIFYVIESVGKNYTFRGTFTADPKFSKGYVWYPFKPWDVVPNHIECKTHFRVFINEESDFGTWRDQNKTLFDKHILEENLYIKTTDPILTYKQE